MSMRMKIAVLASGNGSDLQSIIDAVTSGYIKNTEISCVISNKKNAYALERASKNNIEAIYVGEKSFPSSESYNEYIVKILLEREIDLVALAGYLKVLSPFFVRSFRGKIINIHPSLIPAFCGKGFYGQRVHEAVIESGVSLTGASVHFVDEGVDTGPLISQETVRVEKGETATSLAEKVLEVEHKILPEVIKLFSEERILYENGIVKIKECEEV